MRRINACPARASRDAICLLEVVSPKHDSVLEKVQHVLFELRVQIVRVESAVREGGLVERFHIVEFDGGPLDQRRRDAVWSAVRTAVRAGEAAA